MSKRNENDVLVIKIRTAGPAAQIILSSDRATVRADGEEFSFITVKVVDKNFNLMARAANELTVTIQGKRSIARCDNGNPTSHELFQINTRKAINGQALLILRSAEPPGVVVTSSSSELKEGKTKVIFINK